MPDRRKRESRKYRTTWKDLLSASSSFRSPSARPSSAPPRSSSPSLFMDPPASSTMPVAAPSLAHNDYTPEPHFMRSFVEQDEEPLDNNGETNQPSVPPPCNTEADDYNREDERDELAQIEMISRLSIQDGAEVDDQRTMTETDIKKLAESIRSTMKSKVNRNYLLGVLTLFGRARYSVKQYEHLAFLLSVFEAKEKLPCHSTVRSAIWPFLINHLFVESTIQSFSTRADRQEKKKAVVVKPSKWAEIDVSNLSVFRDMFPDSKPLQTSEQVEEDPLDQQMRIKDTPAVQSRNILLNRCRTLIVKHGELEKSAVAGDVLSLTLVNAPTIESNDLSHFGWKLSRSGIRNVSLDGQVCFSWTPGSTSGQIEAWCSIDDDSLEPWHRSIISLLESLSTRRSKNDVALMPDDSGISDVEDQFQDIYQYDIRAVEDHDDDTQQTIESTTARPESSCQPQDHPGGDQSQNNQRRKKRNQINSSFQAQQARNQGRKKKKVVGSRSQSTSSQNDPPSIYVGDTCSVLFCTNACGISSPTAVVSVIVNRFWKGPTTDSHDLVLWFVESVDGSFKFNSSSTILQIPTLVKSIDESEEAISPVYESDFTDYDYADCGQLRETGEDFYIYRVLLYTDDFNPRSALFPRGSVGGFYMIPLNLPMHKRRGLSGTRTISLTPPGVSTNEVFDFIISDLLDAAVNGIPAVDPFGNKCRIFVDVVGFVADYPASSDVLDVMKHGALAPCTHCTFRRRKLKTESRYAFTTDVNSSHSSFTRGLYRTKILRRSDITKEFSEYLGHNPGSFDDMCTEGKWPLLKFGLRMNRSCKYTEKRSGKPVVNCSFEPYLQNAVAPDHCLTGLAKGLIQTTFEALPNNQARRKLESFICSALIELGLSSQSSIYNVRSKSIHSISMSYVYAALSILPFALESLEIEGDIPTLKLLITLRSLVSLTFWWPSREVDGVESFDYVHGRNKRRYYSDMRTLAKEYLEEVDSFCKDHPEYIKNVDKPNVHRLMELYTHTIIVFGHALFISEMLLEAAHQPLKFSLSKNSSSNSHITAVFHVLLKDWFTRLLELNRLRNGSDDNVKRVATNNLSVLFFGKDVHKLHACVNHLKEKDERLHNEVLQLITDMEDHVLCTLNGAVTNLIEMWYGTAAKTSTAAKGNWTGHKLDGRKGGRNEIISTRETTEFGRSILSQVMNCDGKGIKVYSKAIYKKQSKEKIYKQHILKRGDVVECFIKDDISDHILVHPDEKGHGQSKCFVLHSIVGTCSEKLWGVASELERIGSSSLYKVRSSSKSCLKLVALTVSVRRVYASNHRLRNDLTHSNRDINNLLCGGSSFLLRRRDGYPPRQA